MTGRLHAILSPIMQALSDDLLLLDGLMERALADPVLLGRGGTLIVPCQHMYPHKKNKPSVTPDNPLLMKGADACIMEMAYRLHLGVEVRLRSDLAPRHDVKTDVEKEVAEDYMTYGEHLLIEALHWKSSCIHVSSIGNTKLC